jgi:hypothetical protein
VVTNREHTIYQVLWLFALCRADDQDEVASKVAPVVVFLSNEKCGVFSTGGSSGVDIVISAHRACLGEVRRGSEQAKQLGLAGDVRIRVESRPSTQNLQATLSSESGDATQNGGPRFKPNIIEMVSALLGRTDGSSSQDLAELRQLGAGPHSMVQKSHALGERP